MPICNSSYHSNWETELLRRHVRGVTFTEEVQMLQCFPYRFGQSGSSMLRETLPIQKHCITIYKPQLSYLQTGSWNTKITIVCMVLLSHALNFTWTCTLNEILLIVIYLLVEWWCLLLGFKDIDNLTPLLKPHWLPQGQKRNIASPLYFYWSFQKTFITLTSYKSIFFQNMSVISSHWKEPSWALTLWRFFKTQ